MRIDLGYQSSVSVENDARKAKVSSNRLTDTSVAGDSANLSADSIAISSFRADLAKVPEVRQDAVAALRLSVQNGTYQPDATRIASAMFSEFFGGSTVVN